MKKTEILEVKIKEYGKICHSEEKAEECEKLRRAFVDKFPIETLNQMTLEQYALGTERSQDSFCYWLETKLDCLGTINCVAGARRFGVYFGRLGDDVIKTWRWLEWTKEDFSVIREELIALLEAGKKKDLVGIEMNRFSRMVKGKILACYYPEDYGNVFSYEHIKFFLQNVFDIYTYPDQFEAQEMLLKQKNINPTMKEWSNLKFSAFLYLAYPEAKLKKTVEINEETPQIQWSELAEIFPSEKSYEEIPKKKTERDDNELMSPQVDYEAIARHNASVGKTGEKAVFEYERKRLENIGRQDLSQKVEWVSSVTDSLGYDIKSFNEDGSERHIEVKTNTSSEDVVSFYISAFEYHKLITDPCYEICYVFGKQKKKVYHIDCSQLRKNFKKFATAVSYKVEFITGDTHRCGNSQSNN